MPEVLAAQPLTEVARLCGVSKQTLSKHVVAFSERFDFHSRGMKSPEARLACSEAKRKRAG
jgi:hypothetical protein